MTGDGNISDRIQVMTAGQPEYPARLKEIKNHPRLLYYIGDKDILRKRCVGVVGSRKTTQYGRSVAEAIGKMYGENDVAVVSGMALGIDTCAHSGVLKAGGSAVAVLGSGVDICYPESNWYLKANIEEKGLLISEYAPGVGPRKYHFPQRNRIISGLSESIVVVQAGNNSGALITAEFAAEQGREVYAVPGSIDSRYCFGSNKLIKDGATPVISIEGALEAAGIDGMSRSQAEKILSKTEREIYELLLDHGEMSIDQICFEMDAGVDYISSIVTVMEMKGVVFFTLGKIFIAKE